MTIRNSWYTVKEDIKDLFWDSLYLLSDLVYGFIDLITPEYIGYRLLLHKAKKHMWTKQYLRNFEDTMNKLVYANKIKLKHSDKIMEVARKNSELGYEKYKWCLECGIGRRSKECDVKACYKELKNGKPLFFRSMRIE